MSTGPQLLPLLPHIPPMKHPGAIRYHPVTQEVLFIPVHLCSPSQVLELIRSLACPLPLEVFPHFNHPTSILEFLALWISFKPDIVPVPAPYLQEDPGTLSCRLHPDIMDAINLSLQCVWDVCSEVSSLLGPGGLASTLSKSDKLRKDVEQACTADTVDTCCGHLNYHLENVLVGLTRLVCLHHEAPFHAHSPLSSWPTELPSPDLVQHFHEAWQGKASIAVSQYQDDMLSYLYGESPLGLNAQVLEFEQLVGGASQPMESLSTEVAPSSPLGPPYIAEVCQSALSEGTLCNPSPQGSPSPSLPSLPSLSFLALPPSSLSLSPSSWTSSPSSSPLQNLNSTWFSHKLILHPCTIVLHKLRLTIHLALSPYDHEQLATCCIHS
jgi:hypothetical protein